ncbi:hypothetical protein HGRIS_008313 [Hohenbuehelia grisea]|uniref:tRNA (guanine(37)-N1)-methyltransferase n=1 Tax=Hohenbuehelia grisea TaxID=104357 RepID=A0ABR3J7K6_9AGAR
MIRSIIIQPHSKCFLVARNYLTLAMRRQITLDASPPVHRGMMELDQTVFQKTVPVLAARVPASKTGLILKSDQMKKSLMNLPKVRSVVQDPADPNGARLLLLRVSDEADLPENARTYLAAESEGLITYDLKLNYDYWTADEILQAILPEELCDGSPTGFAITGHIAHMNLNDEYLPYKHIIGQVVLDKNVKIRTVVNKLDSIDHQFRFFKMELIAGVPEYIVEHHESDCRFTFDFTTVYWNSRLHTEHERLVEMFNPEDVVADVFAGVGPFAVPAAKKGCAVLANDLNPNSAKYLERNVKDNKVSELARVFCEDGRDFIRSAAKRAFDDPFLAYAGPKLTRSQEKELRKRQVAQGKPDASTSADSAQPTPAAHRKAISHFVMNLPDSAIQFLDAFRGILAENRPLSGIYSKMPMVHCHCFTRELEPENAEKDIKQRVEEKLGHPISEDVSYHLVRSVAPNKEMYCISFRLPPDVAYASE